MSLSVTIITKNEETNIRDCLESVRFANEIVVLDSSSTDRTRSIAAEYGAKVIVSTTWAGFGVEKNKSIDASTCSWILALDADERVSPKLAQEIKEIVGNIPSAGYDAYEIPRLSWFCGKFIFHSGWRPDYVTRLFRRGSSRFSEELVHERLITKGGVGRLKHDLIHISFRDLETVLKKINLYSSASATQMLKAGKSCSPISAVLHGLWAFIRTYILRLGFLDGWHGFILAVSNAEGTYYRYLKLWQLSSKDKTKFTSDSVKSAGVSQASTSQMKKSDDVD